MSNKFLLHLSGSVLGRLVTHFSLHYLSFSYKISRRFCVTPTSCFFKFPARFSSMSLFVNKTQLQDDSKPLSSRTAAVFTPHGVHRITNTPVVPNSTRGFDPEHANQQVDPFHASGMKDHEHHVNHPSSLDTGKSCETVGVAQVQALPAKPAAPVPGTGGTRLNVVNFKTPKETLLAIQATGIAKTGIPSVELFILGILAGVYLSFGCGLSMFVGGGTQGINGSDPGLSGLYRGAVFPFGLMLIVICGAELFTGNTMLLIPGFLSRKIHWFDVLRNWGIVYIGNFAGSLLIAYFLFDLTELWDRSSGGTVACTSTDPLKKAVGTLKTSYNWYAYQVAQSKMGFNWGNAVLRGIACNWLVTLAIMMAIASEDIIGKLFAIWWPIMAFVTLGFEHSVANMFFIPMGLMVGAPDITGTVAATLISDNSVTTTACVAKWTGTTYGVGDFIWRNQIPVTIGNMISGIFFMGVVYWFIYGREKQAIVPPAGGESGTWKVSSAEAPKKSVDIEMGKTTKTN